MKKLIIALAFTSTIAPTAIAEEIEITFSDADLTEIKENICYAPVETISDETAIGNPLVSDNSGQYTYTKTELQYVSGGDDDDDGGGYYQTINVTVTVDRTEVDSTILDSVLNSSLQEEFTNICI